MLSLVLRNTLRKFSSSCDNFQYSNSSGSDSDSNDRISLKSSSLSPPSTSSSSISSSSSSTTTTPSSSSVSLGSLISLKNYKNFYSSKCDSNDNDYESGPSLIELADAELENDKEKVHTPLQFEYIKHTIGQASANTFDGFRVVVQKQLNLNTIVNHMYWVGSQNVPPMHQFRIILPFDEKVVNVATDADFNLQGEIKAPITKSISGKSNFDIRDDGQQISVDVDYTDSHSASQFQYQRVSGQQQLQTLSLSYMQALSPSFSLGGMGQYTLTKGTIKTGFGGVYDKGEHLIAALWDKEFRVMYLRRVNPNRVHLSTELVIDEAANSQMTLGAEYTLKQSKIQMTVDSSLLLKSSLETTIAPGTMMQLCAEMRQDKEHYKFGYGIVMG